MTGIIHGQPLVAGSATGRALTTNEPISMWGGLDPATGRVIDRHHSLYGQCLSGRILVLPSGRGSCSASGVLLESIRNGTSPAGIIVSQIDPIIGLGAILGEELCGKVVPVILVSADERESIQDSRNMSITVDGTISW
jgi:predicted aconitase with swiveling domain